MQAAGVSPDHVRRCVYEQFGGALQVEYDVRTDALLITADGDWVRSYTQGDPATTALRILRIDGPRGVYNVALSAPLMHHLASSSRKQKPSVVPTSSKKLLLL